MAKWHSKDPAQVMSLDGIFRHSSQRLTDDPFTPVRFTQPVADLGGNTFNIRMQHETDTPHGLIIYTNGKIRLGISTPSNARRKTCHFQANRDRGNPSRMFFEIPRLLAFSAIEFDVSDPVRPD